MTGTVLVTGATGFVGQALVRKLLADGFSVCAPVRRVPAAPDPRVRYVQVSDMPGAVAWQAMLAGVDGVVHCAGRAHVMREQEADVLAAFRRANRDLTVELAQAAKAVGVRRFVFVSTLHVVATETWDRPLTSHTPAMPHSPYAISKYEAEQALQDIVAGSGMELVIVRPPLVYGPHAKGNLHRLLRLIGKGWPLPFGALANRRSVLGLENLLEFLSLCLVHPAAPRQVHMISDGLPISTTQLVRLISAGFPRQPMLLPVPQGLFGKALALVGKSEMAQQLCGSLEVDSRSSEEMLSWKPPVTTETGLRQMAKAFVASQAKAR